MKNNIKKSHDHGKKIHAVIIALIVISFIIGAYFYPQMPDRMMSHWDAAGQVNGDMGKFWALFLMPVITVLMYLMFLVIPKIDPLKKNIDKFRAYFDLFILMLVVFFFYVYMLTIAANLGYAFNMTSAMIPGVGVLFIFIGGMLQHAEKNWFIGIRTPWTLSSDKVWKKTHMLAGKLFQYGGALIILSILLDRLAFWVMIVVAVWAGLYPVVYSYFEYKKEGK
jgi:uncharacterized membrane protein